MKLKLLILIFSLAYTLTIAQEIPPDTLKPENIPLIKIQSDSTSSEEESEDEEETAEEEEPQDTNPANLKYRFSIDGTYTSGNVNRALVQFASGIDWNLSKLLKLSSSPSFIYGQQNKQLTERELFADFRTTILYEKNIYYLAFGSFEQSNLRKINNRFIGAGGVGLKLVQKEKVYVSVTNVLLYEKTDFVMNDKFPDKNLWRNSTRFFGEYTLAKDKMSISHILFIQPSITEKNFRWNGNLIFKYQLSKKISFRSTMENSYESIVVPGRKNNDFRWTFGVVFEGKK